MGRRGPWAGRPCRQKATLLSGSFAQASEEPHGEPLVQRRLPVEHRSYDVKNLVGAILKHVTRGPAFTLSISSRGSAWAVRTSTLVSGNCALIFLVASRPSISGIETSIRIRSG